MSLITDLPPVRAKKIWRDFHASPSQTIDINIGLVASFTVDNLISMLGTALLDEKIIPHIVTADYNQVIQTCLNYPASFKTALDVIVILWRIEDVAPIPFYQAMIQREGALEILTSQMDSLINAFLHLRSVFKGRLIVTIPPFPQGTVADLTHINIANQAGKLYRILVHDFLEKIQKLSQVHLLDLDALQRDFGANAAFDIRKWYLYKQPYTEAFLWKIGSQLARMLRYPRVAEKKCLLLDCDNTLWGGIIGEEGLSGIQLGPESFPGEAFYHFQQYLLYLYHQGILLALVSKNNEEDVWAVFDTHEGMVLKREHIAAYQINWQAKSLNIEAIAKTLNIQFDSLVFVDDNPVEILEVETALPEVTTHLLNDDPATYVTALQKRHCFEKFNLTEEDQQRTHMLHAERHRHDLREKISPADFIASLNLNIDIQAALPSQLDRITQLINKTNQFNLSTIRRSSDAVQALLASPTWEILTLRLSDKFGDYGLVGVAIIEKSDVWHIDTFLISCRALGRGVESTFLDYIIQLAKKAQVQTITANFIPTAKNTPAASFLPTHGFIQQDQYFFRANRDDIRQHPKAVVENSP